MKKGFTLIELLAVIVILAIIAVIAVPIVLNIINESKENASLRSADFYLDAVEMSVAQATLKNQNIPDDTYNILPSGNICIKYKTGTTTCEEELIIEVNGEHPKEGTIVIENGIVVSKSSTTETTTTMTIGDYTITIDSTGKVTASEIAKSSPSCTVISGDINTWGSEIDCAGERFYVMPQDTTNHPSNSNTVTLLAKYPLNMGDYQYNNSETILDSTLKTGIQEQNAVGGCAWDECYGGVWPSWYSEVFNYEESEMPVFIESDQVDFYGEYLQEKGVDNAVATLMSVEQAKQLGCDLETGSCASADSWVKPNYPYWLGSGGISSLSEGIQKGIYAINDNSIDVPLGDIPDTYYVVRTVVIIPQSEIK